MRWTGSASRSTVVMNRVLRLISSLRPGKETTLLKKRVGDAVNIETDLIGKYVEKFLTKTEEPRPMKGRGPPAIDIQMLEKHGFGD